MNRRKSTDPKTGTSQSRSGKKLLAAIAIISAGLACLEKAVDVCQKLVNVFASFS